MLGSDAPHPAKLSKRWGEGRNSTTKKGKLFLATSEQDLRSWMKNALSSFAGEVKREESALRGPGWI